MVRLHTILSHKEYSQQCTYKSLKSFSNIKNQILRDRSSFISRGGRQNVNLEWANITDPPFPDYCWKAFNFICCYKFLLTRIVAHRKWIWFGSVVVLYIHVHWYFIESVNTCLFSFCYHKTFVNWYF